MIHHGHPTANSELNRLELTIHGELRHRERQRQERAAV